MPVVSCPKPIMASVLTNLPLNKLNTTPPLDACSGSLSLVTTRKIGSDVMERPSSVVNEGDLIWRVARWSDCLFYFVCRLKGLLLNHWRKSMLIQHVNHYRAIRKKQQAKHKNGLRKLLIVMLLKSIAAQSITFTPTFNHLYDTYWAVNSNIRRPLHYSTR